MGASLQKAKELEGEQLYNIVDGPKVGSMGIRDPQGAVFAIMPMELLPSQTEYLKERRSQRNTFIPW